MISLLAIPMFSILGAITYYDRGANTHLPRPVWQALFALPFALFVSLNHSYLAPLVWAIITGAVCLAHGPFQALLEPQNPPEGYKHTHYEFIFSWIRPYVSLYAYKVIGLSVSGLLITLPSLPFLGPVVGLSGVLKGPAYIFGSVLSRRWPTRYGEALTGAILWGVLAAVMFVRVG